jgi:hypothetical protein
MRAIALLTPPQMSSPRPPPITRRRRRPSRPSTPLPLIILPSLHDPRLPGRHTRFWLSGHSCPAHWDVTCTRVTPHQVLPVRPTPIFRYFERDPGRPAAGLSHQVISRPFWSPKLTGGPWSGTDMSKHRVLSPLCCSGHYGVALCGIAQQIFGNYAMKSTPAPHRTG